MSKWTAMFGAALVVSQLVTGSAHAFEGHSAGASVQAKKENPQTPGGDGANFPDRPGSLTAGPIGNLQVELDSGWWVGNVRHSRFEVSNIGTGTSYNVRLSTQITMTEPVEPDKHDINKYEELGDVPANAFMFFTLVCNPQPGYVCDRNRAKAITEGSELNSANNDAEDNV